MTRRPQQLFAFTLSFVLTLAIFAGVSSLAAPEHAGQLLVQAKVTGQQA